MNPDDDDAVINQLKQPQVPLDVLPKIGGNFLKSLENRKFQQSSTCKIDLETYAEDELVRKEYTEMRCEMSGTTRSTFLMVFSPDGTRVASTHGNHNIYVSDLRSGKTIRTLDGHPRTPWCIAFHPYRNDLLASGCLAGQVRVWDLSGGSELWTVGSQNVIASIAFHPNDRLLVIATCNELYFWDWSTPQPFMHISTNNIKEKVRYVAFDKLGEKLITGISNTIQSRWERARSNNITPNRSERPRVIVTESNIAQYHRHRVFLSRRNSFYGSYTPQASQPNASTDRVPLSTVPERERRITACYRNLVHEYELLVHRYLQVYRPPTTIDRGTDPMEIETINAAPSTSSQGQQSSQPEDAVPSTSGLQEEPESISSTCFKGFPAAVPISEPSRTNNFEQLLSNSQARRRLIIRTTLGVQTSTENSNESSTVSTTTETAKPENKIRIKCSPKKAFPNSRQETPPEPEPGPSRILHDECEDPFLSSLNTPGPSRIRYPHQKDRDQWHVRMKRLHPGFIKRTIKHARIVNTSSDNSSSEEEPLQPSKRDYVNNIPTSKPNMNNPEPSEREDPEEEAMQPDRYIRFLESIRTTSSGPSAFTPTLQYSTPVHVEQQHANTITESNTSTSRGPTNNSQPSSSSYQDKIVCLANFVSNNACHDAIRKSNGSNPFCDRCGGNIDADTTNPSNSNTEPSTSHNSCDNARLTSGNSSKKIKKPPSKCETVTRQSVAQALKLLRNSRTTSTSSDVARNLSDLPSQPCARTLVNTDTLTTNSTIYTPSSPRRHLISQLFPNSSQRPSNASGIGRYLPSSSNSSWDSFMYGGRQSNNFASDEVVNYSERVNAEDDLNEQQPNLNEFHPFDPPPEFPSINPENIGIGNMYSNIVQDLESSLNNVRNIRASNRPGETSDMLSSFSARLESIMLQSDNILRNLSQTTDMLLSNSEQAERRRSSTTTTTTATTTTTTTSTNEYPVGGHSLGRALFNDPEFYVRDQNSNIPLNRNRVRNEILDSLLRFNDPNEDINSNRWAIAADHTYPRNPDSPRTVSSSSDNLQPLMTSLHLTISHIQRQARLLRIQVEFIERIDRAMLEVAQLQSIRLMFGEIRQHLNNLAGSESRSPGVSSVRQMMAGTRISDSSPYDSPLEDESNQSHSNTEETSNSTVVDGEPSTSNGVNSTGNNGGATGASRRSSARKSVPPSRLLHGARHNRRLSVLNFIPRRLTARERLIRRRLYFRAFSLRSNSNRVHHSSIASNSLLNVSVVNIDTLGVITRRLEHLLTEHIRIIETGVNTGTNMNNIVVDSRENLINERLQACRIRINRLLGQYSNEHSNIETSGVTSDGNSRLHARDSLTTILNILSTFFDVNRTSISQNLRNQIRNVIDLNLLLSDILLLQLVESIPPPTGMNLDPERESLSTRIDQMCSRMLQSRLSGHSQNLTRSLRLMRLTARYASRALGQTYNARRNAIFSNGNSSRRELLGQINSTLQNIHRNRRVYQNPMEVPSYNAEIPVREWYNTISALIRRYSAVTNLPNRTSNTETNNSDDNEEFENGVLPNNTPNDRRQPLYRTNNVNLIHNLESSSSSGTQSRPAWNIPTVQINDIPISESNSTWHSRLTQHRYRLSDLRSSPMGSFFRPRFLHPLYAGINPFEGDLDDQQREQIIDGDMILTITPNHRIQLWDISGGALPEISNSTKNVVVNECKIHNDASIDVSKDGLLMVTLLPSGGYLNVTNRIGVYSLKWESLGQCLYITSFEQNVVSVSLSPLSRYLVVGLASRRVSIVPNEKWTMARIFLLNQNEMPYGSRLPVLREIEQNRETNYMSLNSIRWLPISGQGLIYATNTAQLRILS